MEMQRAPAPGPRVLYCVTLDPGAHVRSSPRVCHCQVCGQVRVPCTARAAKWRAAVRSAAAAMRSRAWVLLVAPVAAGVRGSSGCSESCGRFCAIIVCGWVLRLVSTIYDRARALVPSRAGLLVPRANYDC